MLLTSLYDYTEEHDALYNTGMPDVERGVDVVRNGTNLSRYVRSNPGM
jgi:hypothetical protein